MLCFYVCMALASWEKYHKEFATGQHLLDAPQGGQQGQQQLELAVIGRAGVDAMNSTAGAYGKLKGVFEVLSLRAEQMLEAVFVLGCVTMLASVCITLSLCGPADRASELWSLLQPADK